MTEPEPLFSSFETWPDAVFYAPVFLYWLWLTARYRGFLILLTNPKMHLGGFTADLKSDWFKQLGPEGNAHTAANALIMTSSEKGAAGNAIDMAAAKEAMRAQNIAYPIVAKPDLGKNGTGVQIVKSDEALAEYMRGFPRNSGLILQRYVPYEGEAGVFYIRYPHEAKGRVVSLTLKYFPKVVGDGEKTLRELIEADPRARRIKQLYFARHTKNLDEVVAKGAEVRLVSVGNHCKGAIFKDGAAHITPAMEEAFEKISQEIPEFYFGRFDVRFGELESFKRGEDFYIVEVNGPGSEMTHIWDAKTKLLEAYRTLFGQYRTAWEIGEENRKRGYAQPSVAELIRTWNAERALLATYTWDE